MKSLKGIELVRNILKKYPEGLTPKELARIAGKTPAWAVIYLKRLAAKGMVDPGDRTKTRTYKSLSAKEWEFYF